MKPNVRGLVFLLFLLFTLSNAFSQETGAIKISPENATGWENVGRVFGSGDECEDFLVPLKTPSANLFTVELILSETYPLGKKWGDYTNDGLSDLLVINTHTSVIYSNNGDNTFTLNAGIGLPGNSSITSGDYDNDGDLDFLVIDGMSDRFNRGNRIYNNNGSGTFSELYEPEVSELINGTAEWYDIDNDGELEIAGRTASGFKFFKNMHNYGYTEILIEGISSVSDWKFGDYNNDNYPDLLATGSDFSGNAVTNVFRNNQNGSYSALEVKLPGVYGGSIDWGDYDCDGDLDILLAGRNNFYEYITKVYRNTGNDIFIELEDISLAGLNECKALWGDYDNDGDLDILISGYDDGDCPVKIYDNHGGDIFREQLQVTFGSICSGRPAWCDYDNDGDLDLILSNIIYRNNSVLVNSKPESPVNLSSKVNGNNAILTWNPAVDTETPSDGLSYNVVVSSTIDGVDILSPESDLISGHRKKTETGNSYLGNSHHISNLDPGSYYWSVQAIDNSFIGSQFSESAEFTILPAFTNTNQDMEMVIYSSVSWGDLDNDQDLDLLVSGSSNVGALLKLFENEGDDFFSNFFVLDLEGDWDGSSALGDYDNDGDLDILFCYSNQNSSFIYENLGDKTFEEVEMSIPGLDSCDLSWGDYDNDGDLDFAMSGMNSDMAPVTKIFNNDESIFTEQTEILLKGVSNGTVNWVDYDNDSDLDLFLTGQEESAISSFLYKNEGENNFSEVPNSGIEGVFSNSTDWGDYDNDGDLDLLLGGQDSDGKKIASIYVNLGDDKFHISSAEIKGVELGSARWGDYDCDGDLDVFLTGVGYYYTKLFQNNGNDQFQEVDGVPFGSFKGGQGKWGDYDNDGDLDLVVSGEDDKIKLTKIYKNNGNWDNQPPAAPDNLRSVQDGLGIRFYWDEASDDKTPGVALSYNLRIGTQPGGNNIVSPASDPESGRLMMPGIGNCSQNTSWILNFIPEGDYYWSVQAVDHTFMGGEWAEEQSFETAEIRVDFNADTVCYGEETNFIDLTETTSQPINQWNWDFGDGFTSSLQHPVHLYNSAGVYEVKLTCSSSSSTHFISKFVLVRFAPIVDFSFDIVSLGEHTTFQNSTTSEDSEVVQWEWDFGDGNLFTGENPELHKYQDVGHYEVSLGVISENGCSAAISKTVSVCEEALEIPVIYGAGPAVVYLACSNDSAEFYRWYFNDELINGADSYIYIPESKTGEVRVEISTGGTCYTSSDAYNLSQLTIIQDFDPWEGLKIYPNPTPGLFTLEMDNHIMGELSVDIFGETGSKIINIKFHKETAHFKTQIDLNGQPAGAYLIGLMLEQYRANRTLIVE